MNRKLKSIGMNPIARFTLISNESFGYVARDVYESKTNQAMPRNSVVHPSDPDGKDWDFNDKQMCEQTLPKLWAEFGK